MSVENEIKRITDNAHKLTRPQHLEIQKYLNLNDNVWVFITTDAQLCFFNPEGEKGKELLYIGIRPAKYNVFVSDDPVRDLNNNPDLEPIME